MKISTVLSLVFSSALLLSSVAFADADPDLEARVRGLEARVAALESGSGGGNTIVTNCLCKATDSWGYNYGRFLQKKNALGTVLGEIRLNDIGYGDRRTCEDRLIEEVGCR